jgi:hypothetical protein
MYKGTLRDKDGYLLMEKYDRLIYNIEYYEDFALDILKQGGSIVYEFAGTLDRVDPNGEGFI